MLKSTLYALGSQLSAKIRTLAHRTELFSGWGEEVHRKRAAACKMKLSGVMLLLTRAAVTRIGIRSHAAVRAAAAGVHPANYDIRDSCLLQTDRAEELTTVVNWAYRGKHPDGDKHAWTSERHLLSGIRTDVDSVRAMLRAAVAEGPDMRVLFVATMPDDGPIVGSVQIERSEDGEEADIGFFSVDPDLQGQGIGKRLLLQAERHAATTMGAKKAVLWVISSRADLLSWYTRMSYVKTDQTAPFPVEAGVGVPLPGTSLEFVRLEKMIRRVQD